MLSEFVFLLSTLWLVANSQLLLEAERINLETNYLRRILENIHSQENNLNTVVHAQTKYHWPERGDFSYRNGEEVMYNGSPLGKLLSANPTRFDKESHLLGAGYNVSNQCLNDTMIFLQGVQLMENWALQMLDAQGKPPSGILQGNMLWLGSFTECENVTSNLRILKGTMERFSGKYCLLQIPLHANVTPSNPEAGLMGMAINIGMCIPSSCSSQDATGLANTALSLLPLETLPSVAVVCHGRPDLDNRGIAAIIVCSILAVFLLIGTMYDICFAQIPKYLQTDGLERTFENSSVHPSEKTPLMKRNGGVLPINDPSQLSNQGALGNLLLSFSIYTNGSKILNTKQSAASLSCLNGLRFLSMSWVMLGHTFSISLLLSANMPTYVAKLLQRWTFMAILNGTFSVDSFFFLSGLLVAYLTFKEMNKNKGKLNWALFYFHRFWRLTPAYMLVLMVDICLLRYVSDGPLWSSKGFEQNFCENTWWKNLLYINNFFPFLDMCMSWSWYLANDMQFFLISPLLLMPLYRSRRVGGIVVLLLLVGSFVSTGVVSSVYDLPPTGINLNADVTSPNDYQDMIYVKPYCRIGPYLVGIALGYILFKTNGKFKLNLTVFLQLVVILGWVVASVCCLSVLYGLYSHYHTAPLSVTVSALYNVISRTVWALGLAWLVFACCTGYGGFINTFLSWEAFIPLSRLTYCAYLIHPLIMIVYLTSSHSPLYLTDMTMVYLFMASMVATYLLAFLTSLAFEAPMMGLEKVILRRGTRT